MIPIGASSSERVALIRCEDRRWRAFHVSSAADSDRTLIAFRTSEPIKTAFIGVSSSLPEWLKPAANAETTTLRELESIVRETHRRALRSQ